MIYTAIADYRRLLPEIIEEKEGISSPYSLFPEKLRSYISSPKSPEVRQSRLGGYLLLFHTVRFLFGRTDFKIEFTEAGKPYFDSSELKDLSFNISHSGGLCAVCICDEGKAVGVDIQEEIEKEKAERIKERFYEGEIPMEESPDPVYLFGGFSSFGDCFFAEIPSEGIELCDPSESFLDRWSLCEAVMKCDGGGFASYGNIEKLLSKTKRQTIRLTYKGKKYSLSTVSEK